MKQVPIIEQLLGLPGIVGIKEQPGKSMEETLIKKENIILDDVMLGRITIAEAYKRMLDNYIDPRTLPSRLRYQGRR